MMQRSKLGVLSKSKFEIVLQYFWPWIVGRYMESRSTEGQVLDWSAQLVETTQSAIYCPLEDKDKDNDKDKVPNWFRQLVWHALSTLRQRQRERERQRQRQRQKQRQKQRQIQSAQLVQTTSLARTVHFKTKTKTMTKTEKVPNWLRRLSLWQKQTNDSNLWGWMMTFLHCAFPNCPHEKMHSHIGQLVETTKSGGK